MSSKGVDPLKCKRNFKLLFFIPLAIKCDDIDNSDRLNLKQA